tara:strand:- start:648 stop:1766 length:1119 start_codon:yes stop_codon:yes gene_type:complete
MVEKGIQLSAALVDLDLVDKETLHLESRKFTRKNIITFFSLEEGKFETRAGATPGKDAQIFDFGPGEIFVDGFKEFADSASMLAVYQTHDETFLATNQNFVALRPRLGLSTRDDIFIRYLGKAYTVEDAANMANMNHEEVGRLLAALLAVNAVEERKPSLELFQARLIEEKRRHQDEVTQLREEMTTREKRLFDAFERVLSKLDDVVGGSGGSLAGTLQEGVGSLIPQSSGTLVMGSGGADDDEQTVQTEVLNLDGGSPANVSAEDALDALGDGEGGEEAQAESRFKEGMALAQEGKLDEAESALRDALRLDASRPEFLMTLAEILLQNPKYDRSGTLPVVRSLLDRAVQIDPEHEGVTEFRDKVAAEMSQA